MTQSVTPTLIAPATAVQATVAPLLHEPHKGRAELHFQRLLSVSQPQEGLGEGGSPAPRELAGCWLYLQAGPS